VDNLIKTIKENTSDFVWYGLDGPVRITFMGSDTSGHYGHAGNPPDIGGSLPGGGHAAIGLDSEEIHFLKINGLETLIALNGNLDIRDFDLEVVEALKGLEHIPREMMKEAHERGYKLIVGKGNVTDFPENADLKGVTPRGWPKDLTWETAEGMGGNPTFIGTRQKNRISDRLRYVAQHEFGHLFDNATGIMRFSDSEKFQSLHTKYKSKLSPYEKQAGFAGLQETFANKFSDYFDGPSSNNLLKKNFPDVWDYMKEKFGEGPSNESIS